MNEKEYKEWKENNPKEWDEVFKNAFDLYYKLNARGGDDSVAFVMCGEEITWGRIKKAFEDKDELCDELVRIRKQSLDYKDRREKQEIIYYVSFFLYKGRIGNPDFLNIVGEYIKVDENQKITPEFLLDALKNGKFSSNINFTSKCVLPEGINCTIISWNKITK